MKTTTKTAFELELNSAGDLVIRADGGLPLTIERAGLSPESRIALTTFVKACNELHSIDEWEQGEVVIPDRGCMVRDLHGLPMAIFRGQRIDERSTIEQILAITEPQPVRLLRFGAELEVESMLREMLTVKGQEGLAQSVLIQKRTLAAAQGV